MDMRNTDIELEKFLDDLAAGARAGDRLPTVRELMKRFGLSQVVVQRVFHNMKERGLIEIRPGRGIFFLATEANPGAIARSAAEPGGGAVLSNGRPRSLLVLRRSVNIDRGRTFIEKLNRRFAEGGHKVIEVSFSDPDHAKTVLKTLPRFDACIIQSVYHSIPSDMLATIHEKTNVVAFDGVGMVSAGVDSIGTEWGEPLTEAVTLLLHRGHRRLCFAATSMPFLATSLGFRRWDYLRKSLPDVSLETVRVPQLPDEGYAEALVAELKTRIDENRRLPFTALIAWGISDGARFHELLDSVGLSVPDDLSVILLGRTDLINEHAGFFESIGTRVDDQVNMMFEAICRRWQEPSLPFGVYLVPVAHREGASVRNLDQIQPDVAIR